MSERSTAKSRNSFSIFARHDAAGEPIEVEKESFKLAARNTYLADTLTDFQLSSIAGQGVPVGPTFSLDGTSIYSFQRPLSILFDDIAWNSPLQRTRPVYRKSFILQSRTALWH